MKSMFLIALMAWSTLVFAEKYQFNVINIEYFEDEESYLVFASNGLVYSVKSDKEDVLSALNEARETDLAVTVSLRVDSAFKDLRNEYPEISKVEFGELMTIESPKSNSLKGLEDFTDSDLTPLSDYKVTELSDMDSAQRLFDTMRTRTRRRSQCYNRAHIWNYEMWRYQGRKMTGKMWIFFTSRYIKKYKYKWWFHVAPYVEVAGQDEAVVLDREFSRSPQLRTDWKNDYMKNNWNCPEVTKYSDYRNNQWSNDCYLIQSSMYYWQPINLKTLEEEGVQKKFFVDGEVSRAYRNGFRRRSLDEDGIVLD